MLHARHLVRHTQRTLRRSRRRLAQAISRRRWRRQARSAGWVVVITYARTGSTLLTGVLNTLDGYCIRGENDGAVVGLQTWHTRMARRSRKYRQAPGPSHPFHGIEDYPAQWGLERMRELLVGAWLRPPRDARVLGYKELRWPSGDLAGHLAFLRRLLPGVRFIYNCRDIEAVARSGWYTGTPDERAWIASREAEIRQVAAADSDGYLLQYEDLIAGPQEFTRLAAWLGTTPNPGAVAQAFATRHSISNSTATPDVLVS